MGVASVQTVAIAGSTYPCGNSSTATETARLSWGDSNWYFQHDPSDCTKARVGNTAWTAQYIFNFMRWNNNYPASGPTCLLGHRMISNYNTRDTYNTMSSGGKSFCSGKTYQYGNYNGYVLTDANTTSVRLQNLWSWAKAANPSYVYVGGPGGGGECFRDLQTITLANNFRILPPVGLSVSWPSVIGNNVTASIQKWAENVNITGTPTTYPNAKYWNWALDLLNKDGGFVAHYADNLAENKSVTLPGNSFYTASGLPSSAQAASSKYTFVKNGAYKLRVVVNNSFNQRQSTTSGLFYTAPPEPKVKITSCVYDPNTKLCKLTFTYSKEKDGGGQGERLRYDIYDVQTGASLSGKDNITISTVTDGRAMSGTITVTGIPTATNIGVRVELATADDNYNATKTKAQATVYSPVADTAFISFDWDELRRTCVITATAPGAKQTRLSAGYSPNNYNVSTKLTAGETGTITVKDLNHGGGQILYLEAMPEAADSHQYKDEVAKISIPIPNPILGIKTYPCGSGRDSEYIVDIIEHKKNNTCSPRWQNGDRVVKKNPC